MKTMLVLVGLVLMLAIGTSNMAHAWEVLGVGTEALLGGDLTDPENDGDPEADVNYNAIFTSNDEPGFGGGEFSFNVFDNLLGPSNDKWCCGPAGGIPEEGLQITAQLEGAYTLTHFTISSANDEAPRDPTTWAIQGSNDGVNFTTIFSLEDESVWTERLQVVRFDAGSDFDVQSTAYEYLRFVCYNTVGNPNGAYYQLGEIEYFGSMGTAVDSKAKLTTTWGDLKE